MDSTSPSRRPRFRLALAVVATLVAPALAVGCGAKVAVDLDPGSGSGGSGGAGGSGSGGGNVNSGGTGAADGGCVFSTSVMGTLMHLPSCFKVPAGGCPNQYDAPLFIFPSSSCVVLVSVDCGPVATSDQCCYMITEEVQPCAP